VRDGEPTIAVVGGTAAYEGARGSVTDMNRVEATVHLLATREAGAPAPGLAPPPCGR
jgi:hypothetical protein